MSFHTICCRLLFGCRIVLPLLLIAALLVPGCAGKRTDLFTTLDEIEAEEAAKADANAAAEADDPSLIAEDEVEQRSAFLSSFSGEKSFAVEDAAPRRSMRDRFRSMLPGSSAAVEEVVTTDPFIDSDVRAEPEPAKVPKKKSVAKSDSPSVEELLASFETESPKTVGTGKPWWENEKQASLTTKPVPDSSGRRDLHDIGGNQKSYSHEFDSRLEELRAELSSVNTPSARSRKYLMPNSNDNVILTSAREPVVSESPWADQSPVSENLPFASEATPATSPAVASVDGAKERIQAMLANARRDRENRNLRRAYRTALDAQELAVLENVSFSTGEEHPQKLAEMIAADLRGDNISTVSSTRHIAEEPQASEINPFATESNPFAENATTLVESSKSKVPTNPFTSTSKILLESTKEKEQINPFAPNVATDSEVEAMPEIIASTSSFGFPEFAAGEPMWGTLGVTKKDETTDSQSASQSNADEGTQGSGVSLLPPDDDFPSDAAKLDWGVSDTEFGSPAAGEPADAIQLTTHKSPGFTLKREDEPRDQLPGLSDADNRELLSTVAKQRDRVLTPKMAEWPALPSPNQVASRTVAQGGPIRIPQAPRYSLDDQVNVAAAVPAKKTSSSSNGSLLGQFWRSQPVWFIGGLVLLVIALRLLPWPKQETA